MVAKCEAEGQHVEDSKKLKCEPQEEIHIQKERSEFENLMLNNIQNVSLTNRCDINDNNSV